MKKILVITVLFTVLAFPLLAQNAVIKEVSGKVEVRPPGAAWKTAEVGMQVLGGTYISTGFGAKAVLNIGESVLQVKQLTRMQIENIIEQEGTLNTNLYLRVGKVRAEVKSTEGLSNNFKLRSPVSTAAVRGTTFEYDGLALWVENGTVVLSNLLGQERAYSGGEEGQTGAYTPPPDPEEIKEILYEVVSNTQEEGGLVVLPDIEENALVIITLQWD